MPPSAKHIKTVINLELIFSFQTRTKIRILEVSGSTIELMRIMAAKPEVLALPSGFAAEVGF